MTQSKMSGLEVVPYVPLFFTELVPRKSAVFFDLDIIVNKCSITASDQDVIVLESTKDHQGEESTASDNSSIDKQSTTGKKIMEWMNSNEESEFMDYEVENAAISTDENGWNALHWAVWNQDEARINVLISNAEFSSMVIQQTIKDVKCESSLTLKSDDLSKVQTDHSQIDSTDSPKTDNKLVTVVLGNGQEKLDNYEKEEHGTEETGNTDNVDQTICNGDKDNFIKQTCVAKGSTPLHIAMLLENIPITEKIMSTEKAWSIEDSNHYTPLQLAARGDKVQIFKKLMSLELKINQVNSNGDSILHTAIASGSINVARYLLSKDEVDTTLVNKYKKQLLHVAIQTTNTEILQLILEKQNRYLVPVKTNSINPLRFAIMQNNIDSLKILMDTNDFSDILLRNEPNEDPILHITSRLGLYKLTHLLLTNGADVTLKSLKRSKFRKGQKTALDVAVDMGYLDIALLLLSAGAVQNYTGQSGQSNDSHGNMGLIFHNLENSCQTKEMILKLLQFGYKFTSDVYKFVAEKNEDFNNENKFCQERCHMMTMIREFYKQPLSLYRLTSNAILHNLTPNAWVNIKALPIPKIIMADITQRLDDKKLGIMRNEIQ